MGRARLSILAGLAAIACAAPAAAATQYRPAFGVRLEERYDDDALPGGGADLQSKLAPEVGGRIFNEQLRFEGAYSPIFTQHLENGDITVDQHAALKLRDQITRRFALRSEAFVYRVQDTSTLPRFGVARANVPALWSVAKLDGDYRITPTGTFEAGYHGELTKLYMDNLPVSTFHEVFGGLKKALGPRFELGARYRYQLFAADSHAVADSQSVSGLARYAMGRHSFVRLEAGPALFDAYAGNKALVPRFSGEIGYDARGVAVGLSTGRDFIGAAGYATAIWADYVQGAASWRATRSLNFYLGAGVFRNGLAPDQPTEAKGYVGAAGGEYKLTRDLGVQLAYDRIVQIDTTGNGLDMSRNILSARIELRTH